WQEVHPGRLLHVRCFSKQQHLDLVCIYQHALPFEASSLTSTLAKRKQPWNKLDSLLQSFPVRSSVVVAGDFNSNLCSSGSCIGHSILHNAAKPAVVEERQWLSGLLASHQLTALNSWSRKLPTYWHPSGSSQIDWILVRSSLADSSAKKCAPSDAPVAGWRSAGHKVLKASIPLNWMPWRASARRREQEQALRRDAVQGSSPLQEVIQEVSSCAVPARQVPARRTIRLRDDLLLHPKAECTLLAEYAEDLFRARRSVDMPQLSLSLDPGILSPEIWVSALGSLRAGKAVPAGQPSVQQWRDCSYLVADRLSHIARDALCCSDSKVPTEWSTVQLARLAKAGKTPSRPQNLKSIGLMSADSKAFLNVLRSAIAPYVEAVMHDQPQYAYRKGASTSDALMRAAGHCSTVRMLLQRHHNDQTSKLLGDASIPCAGGLMCGLDLQKAFDALPHSELYAAMIDAGVPDSLAATITQEFHAAVRELRLLIEALRSLEMSVNFQKSVV
ncbi:Pol, partial [Symbiodinium microadriaticum]